MGCLGFADFHAQITKESSQEHVNIFVPLLPTGFICSPPWPASSAPTTSDQSTNWLEPKKQVIVPRSPSVRPSMVDLVVCKYQ